MPQAFSENLADLSGGVSIDPTPEQEKAVGASQRCSGCGELVYKGLSVRWHSCPDCGTSLHRDHNAAKNIERAGQALRGGVALAALEN